MTDKPWENEPDYLEGSYGDVPWFIVRAPLEHLCGYIAVPKQHPWYGLDARDLGIDVHGGVTWSDNDMPGIGSHDEVHDKLARDITKRFPGQFIGFDCGHYMDFVPGMPQFMTGRYPFGEEVYRDINYVRGECERLAQQAIAAIESRMLLRGTCDS